MLCNTFRSHTFIYVNICNAFTVASPNPDMSLQYEHKALIN